MLRSTFQLSAGLGARRERALWDAGIVDWQQAIGVRGKIGEQLRAAISAAETALAARDIATLASLLPSREYWRLFPEFSDGAAYIDIETSDDIVGFDGISAIGILDRRGIRLLLAGRDLAEFPAHAAAAKWSTLVTFNGLSFDVPILRRAFPDWTPPACHIDLRHTLKRAGHDGGLKHIEHQLSSLYLRRPGHLAELDGWSTGPLFRRGRDGNRAALRRFAEYNLYDVVSLRTLMPYAYNKLAAQTPLTVDELPIPERGDLLYDISKILLSL